MPNTQHPDLDRALQLAADRRATDAFLFPGEPLALRVSDGIEPTTLPPYSPTTLVEISTAALGPERVASLPTTGHAFTTVHLPGVATAQLTAAHASGQLAITLRIIPTFIPGVADIATPQEVLEAAARKSGLILFSGPVGSGKTTSAYALLSHINSTQSRLICTVEEPIGFAFPTRRPLLLQRQVGTDVPDTVTGIVASLRQDADVIFVGELRSPEDVTTSLTAATLNRLVITQTHARTALAAVRRLVEVQPPEYSERVRRQLAHALLVSVAQTLLPTPDGKRVAAYDVFVPDAAFRHALSTGGPLARPATHRTILDHVHALAHSGAITETVAARALSEFTPLYDP